MASELTTEFRWPYEDGTLETLQITLFQRIEFKTVTLQMTQDEYDLFADDTDAETLTANRYRPLDVTTNTKLLKWLFNGKLIFYIKIINENC